ncbi:ligand-dependent nuclear receptor corepressor-like protein [Asterias amurensis]|uniref:ligand-dependent nuclear receptor corepressor-like protein n=1 Tax=Asterias amurensis TaxID=7602 RepID=UPI003AB62BAA
MAAATPCGTNRCSNERKQLRKELERGRKNLIAYIGLECVVESLFGIDFVKKISPFKDDEEEEVQIGEDWQSEEKCLLCKSRQRAVEDTIAQHQAYIDKIECGLTNGRGRPEHTSQQQRLLRAEQWLAKSVNDIHTHEVEYGSDGEQNQPLDLSRQGYLDREAAYVDTQGVLGPSNKQHMLKVPSITVHRPSKNKMGRPPKGYGSASYTQDDLKLALTEVRSGKVGTRRAAMLFGIPRSTIRNHLNRHSFLVVEEENDILETQNASEYRGKNGLEDEIGVNGKLLSDGKFQTQDEGEDIVSRLRNFLVSHTIPVKHLDDDLENGLSQEILQDLVASYVRLSLVAGLDADRLHEENVAKCNHDQNGEAKLPQHLLETLIHCHLTAEEECSKVNGSRDPKALKSSIKQPRPQTLPDLKIPLYKPMNSCSENQESGDESPNDKADSQDGMDMQEWRQTYGMSSKPSSPQQSQRSGCSQDSAGKRPKRGRYRCYDRDCLMQAVNAVQRGEMTVTRAGNVYGVPHSTLEYKVKERHLKRLGKRMGNQKIKMEYDPSESSPSSQGLPTTVYQQEVQQMSAINATHRPFESFAERLRAMSEKQAMHTNFSFLKQSLAGQQQQPHQQPTAYLAQTLLAPGLGISPELSDKCYILDGQHAAAIASHSLGLAKQWIGWPVHPAFKTAAYPHVKEGLNGSPAVLYASPDLVGMRNSSVSDAINRLVEAQIYDSLYGGETQTPSSRVTGKGDACGSTSHIESSIIEALDSGPSTSSVKQEPGSPGGVRGYGSSEGSKKRPHSTTTESEAPHSATKVPRAGQE